MYEYLIESTLMSDESNVTEILVDRILENWGTTCTCYIVYDSAQSKELYVCAANSWYWADVLYNL